MGHITDILANIISSSIQTYGYLAVFILMTLESMLVPIPSEITMTFAGFLVGKGIFSFWLLVLMGALANLVGSLGAYWIGRAAQDQLLETWIRKYGKYLLITVDDVERSERWFRKHGELVTFTSRLLPVVRTFISLPAGVAEMNLKKFSIYTFLGSFIWSAVLAYIGIILGKNWHSIEVYTRPFQLVIVISIALLATWYLGYKIKKICRQKNIKPYGRK